MKPAVVAAAGGGTTVISAVALARASAPDWLVVMVVVLGAALVFVYLVFPQDSGDRLTWWRHMVPRPPHDGEGGSNEAPG